MLRRVAPMDDLKLAKSSTDPEKWSDSELLETSLSVLSKILSPSLPNRQTLSVYLKWLEVHRQNPSELTKSWDNTLLHWGHALRARGIDKEDVIATTRKWKVENEPFDSPAYAYGNRRCPPMSYDIGKAWGEIRGTRETHYQVPVLSSGPGKYGDSWRPSKFLKPDDFAGPPPGIYVCRRCFTSGHFLEVCPTNMDPSFDKAPGMDYKCLICHKYGLHYRSLCPLNTDPYCIIQKRRDLGIDTPDDSSLGILRDRQRKIDEHEDDLFRGRPIDRSWGRDARETSYHPSPNWSPPDETMSPLPTHSLNTSKKSEEIINRIKKIDGIKMRIVQSDSSVDTADVLMMRNKCAGSRQSEKRTRLASPDGGSIHSRREANDKSPSPTKSGTLRTKIRMINSHEAWGAQGGELDKDAQELIAEKAIYQARLEALENKPTKGVMDREYGVDVEMEDSPGLALRFNAPSPKRSKSSSHRPRTPAVSLEKMDIDRPETKSKIGPHNEFIKKLVHIHPELKHIVNPATPRKSAVDMWEDDEGRRSKMLALMNAIGSPSFDPFDSVGEPNQLASERPSVRNRMHRILDGDGGNAFDRNTRLALQPFSGWSTAGTVKSKSDGD